MLPEPQGGPPPWSSGSILVVGLAVTLIATFLLGTQFTWPFGLIVGFGLAGLTAALAWAAVHPPDPRG